MSSIESVILELLESSSLPGIYKVLIKNLLPDMSRIQQENILKILFSDQKNTEILKKKKMAIYRRYEPMIDSILKGAENRSADGGMDPMILNFIKENQEKKKSKTTSLKLDTLKNTLTAK